jgi:hypothetical protein
LRIMPPCNTSNGNKRNELRGRFVSQIVIIEFCINNGKIQFHRTHGKSEA